MSKKQERQSCDCNCNCDCGDHLASALRSLADAVEKCCPPSQKDD